MPQLVITDIDSRDNESATVYNVADDTEATDALLVDCERTSSAEFTNGVMQHWLRRASGKFSVTVANDDVAVVTDNGPRVRFEYLP